MTPYLEVAMCYNNIKSRIPFTPSVALVLGSGLGGFADDLEIKAEIDYSDIDGFPISTAPGHKGRFVFAYINNVPTVIMQGRIHYYEGYSIQKVVLPIRLMHMMGAKVLFLSNASGGVNLAYNAGDFMMISDQISFSVPSPLIGENDEKFGTRFPDMSEIYCKDLQNAILQASTKENINIHTGVYMQLPGPNFETPAEIKAARILGADAVGMSTACEAICANHLGMKICAISCISNMAAGVLPIKLSGDDVNKTADAVGHIFCRLVRASIKNIGDII